MNLVTVSGSIEPIKAGFSASFNISIVIITPATHFIHMVQCRGNSTVSIASVFVST